jgi:hypothetical protein
MQMKHVDTEWLLKYSQIKMDLSLAALDYRRDKERIRAAGILARGTHIPR